jgi:hypothetical protein
MGVFMKLLALVLPVALALFGALGPAAVGSGAPRQGGWRTFDGSWSASGQRQSLPTETRRLASSMYLSGAVVLAGDGVSRGFRGEVIGFDDGTAASVGRCVWTDEHGDQVYSTLKGEAFGAGRRFVGTFTGGSGRYAGAAGEYSFEWLYVIEAEKGVIQGRAVGLKGRFRTEEGR